MKSIKELPKSERPREKLLERGAGSLSDHELLTILLGRGTANHPVQSLARQLISLVDEKGIGLDAGNLMSIKGIGAAKAATIAAAFEFVRRRIKPRGVKIQSPKDILPLIRHYGDRKQEHFICISLNGANEVITVRVVTIGLVNKSQIHPREVFSDVIAERAAAVIIAHNHPSGNLNPSREDAAVTRQIQAAADILGIPLLDHIIFDHTAYYSFKEDSRLPDAGPLALHGENMV